MKANALVILLALAYTSTYAQTNAGGVAASEQKEPQESGAPATQPLQDSVGTFRPGSGTVIVAELSKALDAKRAKVGDQVECNVVQDLVYKGKIIIPHGAKVSGHVTEAVEYTRDHSSRLGLLFEKVLLKDKRELPFQYPAVVEALAAPVRHIVVPTSRLDQMPVQMEKGKSTGGSALDAVQSNPEIMGANFPQTTGVISAANRGIAGLKGLTLERSTPEAVTIVAEKENVKLSGRTQMVLRVIDGKK